MREVQVFPLSPIFATWTFYFIVLTKLINLTVIQVAISVHHHLLVKIDLRNLLCMISVRMKCISTNFAHTTLTEYLRATITHFTW